MKNITKKFLVFGSFLSALLFLSDAFVFGQQAVFSRGEASSGLWWDSSNPWIRACDNWWLDRPDKNTCGNWPNIGRNDVFVGHNNNNPMTVNGAWFQLRDMTIQSTVSIARTFNNSSGGLSFSRGLYNHSTQNQTFNVPIGIDATSVDFEALNGNLTLTNSIFINANTARFLGSQNTTVSGVLQGSGGNILKIGSGILTLTAATNSYTGSTTITEGTLRLNPSSNATMSSEFRMNGGTLSTIDIAAGRTISTSGMLRLDANSTIDLATVKHDLIFANSNTSSWAAGTTLTILNWTGTPGSSGDGARIFFGSGDTGLSLAQLAQINIVGFDHGAMLLESGELVAAPNPLPVTFLGMSASCQQQGVVIVNWETASEFNASHFVVERSTDGLFWSNIGSVHASGNSTTTNSYQFIDKKPIQTKTSYYRLVQCDLDGKSEIYGPISSWCEQDKREHLLFPNPTKDVSHYFFHWNQPKTTLTIHVYDAQGRSMFELSRLVVPGNNMIDIDITGLISGNYILVVRYEDNVIDITKLVKY